MKPRRHVDAVPEGDWDVAVIGGGPAGLLAAGRAAMLGARVILLEKMEKPARKLRITGKGRANITNMRPLEAHLEEIRPESRFLRQAFQAFFNEDLLGLLAGQGVATKTERGDRVFPANDRAWDVAEALVAWARAQGAEIRCRSRVTGLCVEQGVFRNLEFADTRSGAVQRLEARCVILATGGQSYPLTGSTGDGYRFAEAAGHRIAPLRPSLVPLHTRPAHPGAKGLILKNVRLDLWIEGRRQAQEFGEAEFTAQGLQGAAVLRLSRAAVEALGAGRRVALGLDLKPALEPTQLEARLIRELAARAREHCGSLLRAFLPGPLLPVIADRLGLALSGPASQLQGGRGKAFLELLKDWRFEVVGHGGWEEAIVTAGGVSLREVDPRTLASRRVEGLFLAGELLDLDANTGGYNLQIAFSTGWLAGESAARRAMGAPSAD